LILAQLAEQIVGQGGAEVARVGLFREHADRGLRLQATELLGCGQPGRTFTYHHVAFLRHLLDGGERNTCGIGPGELRQGSSPPYPLLLKFPAV
jgi:hypothetical protein